MNKGRALGFCLGWTKNKLHSLKTLAHNLEHNVAVSRRTRYYSAATSKALKGHDRGDEKPNSALARCLQSLGGEVFRQLEEEGSYSADDMNPILLTIHSETFVVNKEEGIRNARKVLGGANRGVAEAYLGALNFKEARDYCLKALEMHSKDPLEMARDKRLLDVIESGYELDRKGPPSERREFLGWRILSFEFKFAAEIIVKGSNSLESGTHKLREILTRTKKDDEDILYAQIFVTMARELLWRDDELEGIEEVFGESKRWLALAMDILSKNQLTWHIAVAEAYMEISTLYGVMNECETAMSLLKKAKRMVEKLDPIVDMGWQQRRREEIVVELDAKMGWLLFLAGSYESAAASLGKTIPRMKECFGEDDIKLGLAYNNLGAAYMELHKLPSAARALGLANDIITKRYSPLHRYSIESRRNLTKAYAAMEDYETAIKFHLEVLKPLEAYVNKEWPDDGDEIPLDSETNWVYDRKKFLEDNKGNDVPLLPLHEHPWWDISNRVLNQVHEDEKQLKQLERNAPLIGAQHIKALPMFCDRGLDYYFEVVLYERTLKMSRASRNVCVCEARDKDREG